jgi:hypothetical protein
MGSDRERGRLAEASDNLCGRRHGEEDMAGEANTVQRRNIFYIFFFSEGLARDRVGLPRVW